MATESALPATSSKARYTLLRAGQVLVAWGLIVSVQVAVGDLLIGPLRGSVGTGDNDAERWLAGYRSGTLTHIGQGVTLLGETWTVVTLGPALLLITWLWLREIRVVVYLATAIVGEVAAYLLTVTLVSRPRPPVPVLDPGLDPEHSYPSGHVAATVAMYGGLAVIIWVFRGSRWRRWGVALLVLPPMVAIARLYLGAHHPSDVMASLVFMSAWLAVSAAVILPAGGARRLLPSGPG